MAHTRYLSVCQFATIVALSAHAAFAQVPVTSDNARAIERGNEAVSAFEAGHFREAIALFRDAEQLHHSPVFLVYTARALRELGRLLEARDLYRRVAGESLEPSAPPPWHKAQAEARAELGALERVVPSAVVTLEGASSNAKVMLDGQPVSAGTLLELDPGTHQVEVSDTNGTATQTFELAAGERQREVMVKIGPGSTARKPQQIAPGPAPPAAGGMYVPGLALTVAGGATLIAGSVMGVLALNAKSTAHSELPASCDGSLCPDSTKPEVDQVTARERHLATATNVLLVTGGLLLATGVTLMLIQPGKKTTVTAGLALGTAEVGVQF